ncbi:MAG TPA: nucleotidyltransferase, partial [Bacteroidetes bacterium]|nr:nucleotidyltransferase [Bacteroidota bacterium]
MKDNKDYKHELFKKLVIIGKSLDLTPTQYKLAKSRYEAVGKWLADGEYCLFGTGKKQCFKDGNIYPQGSIRLETAVKPIGQNEFDIDLVFFTPNISVDDISPEFLKELIGNRLQEHETYKNMLTETNRGWCINYADEFHLDITPSLDKQDEPYNTSELVADSKLKNYMTANPKGYSKWFDDSSLIIPMFPLTRELFKSDLSMEENIVAMESAAEIEELPEHEPTKLLLKRFVQIFKRHRDTMFEGKDDAPISVIITTLATKSYLYCIENFDYNNEYDLMLDTLQYMKKYIDIKNGLYWIENPSIKSENFAEKWNEKIIKKKNFDSWHDTCSKFFNKFHPNMGQDILLKSLEEGFGSKPTKLIRDKYIDELNQNRHNNLITT